MAPAPSLYSPPACLGSTGVQWLSPRGHASAEVGLSGSSSSQAAEGSSLFQGDTALFLGGFTPPFPALTCRFACFPWSLLPPHTRASPLHAETSLQTSSGKQAGKEQQVWGSLGAQEILPASHLLGPGYETGRLVSEDRGIGQLRQVAK